MRILVLAPEPFYQERGTPMAVALVLRVLSEGHERIDIATYAEGSDRVFPNTAIHRIPRLPFVRNVPPGFSFRKVWSDCFLLILAFRLAIKHRYHIVHAVEESVYIALLLKMFFKVPYVYDMDSSLPEQLIEKHSFLRPFRRLLVFFEQIAIRHAAAVLPVCDFLAGLAQHSGARKITVLKDVPLTEEGLEEPLVDSLRGAFHHNGTLFLYAGNLETYQGLELMIEAFRMAVREGMQGILVIIGGRPDQLDSFRKKWQSESRILFLGPKPAAHLGSYLSQADVLVSPRLSGTNTPMKIFSYLHSGKPVLASDILSHTQVLNQEIAFLCAPEKYEMAKAFKTLSSDVSLRIALGRAGKEYVQKEHTYPVFKRNLEELYAGLNPQ